MTDATTAAKAILRDLDDTGISYGHAALRGGENALVVLARLNEAIEKLECARAELAVAINEGRHQSILIAQVHVIDAMACLRNEDA